MGILNPSAYLRPGNWLLFSVSNNPGRGIFYRFSRHWRTHCPPDCGTRSLCDQFSNRISFEEIPLVFFLDRNGRASINLNN